MGFNKRRYRVSLVMMRHVVASRVILETRPSESAESPGVFVCLLSPEILERRGAQLRVSGRVLDQLVA
jgi:hypothetical protein